MGTLGTSGHPRDVHCSDSALTSLTRSSTGHCLSTAQPVSMGQPCVSTHPLAWGRTRSLPPSPFFLTDLTGFARMQATKGLAYKAILNQTSLCFPRDSNSLLPVGCSAHTAHNALKHRGTMERKHCEATGSPGTQGRLLAQPPHSSPQLHCLH